MLAKKLSQISKQVEKYAEEIVVLESRKKEAVKNEDFDTANEIKETIISLKQNLRDVINGQELDLFDEEVGRNKALYMICIHIHIQYPDDSTYSLM
jgi:hypothetical protein